jgi:anaerobic dimethyl sulfoxide reductase subunit A
MNNASDSRRDFLKNAGLVSAGIGILPSYMVKGFSVLHPQLHASMGIGSPVDGKWIPVVCWHDCGGRCALKAWVVDNKVLRLKSDDTHEDSPDYPQQRACVRGRSQRMQVFAPDRLKYPMRRKHWAPGGGDKSLRGKDEWIRISWDEALDIVVNELKRIKEKYGNESIFSPGGEIKRTLNLYGGCVDSWSNDSLGSWMGSGKQIGLYAKKPNNGFDWVGCIGDRMDMRNSELVVMWGVNPAWSSPGSPTHNFIQVKKAGARFIFIDPFYSSSAAILADDWYPVRPGTDHAMILGMMHTLLDEDNPGNNPLIDWDFLNRCTVGFDRDHMPEGVDPSENFKDYLLGKNDGQPKDAEWASEICGIPEDRIKMLAREIGRTKKVALLTSWAPARVNNADSWPQAFMTLGCMTGHIGESGRMTGTSIHIASGNGGPPLVYAGSSGLVDIPNPVGGGSSYTRGRPENKLSIPGNQIWNAILTGEYTAGKDRTRKIDIRLMYLGGVTNMLGSREGQKKGFEAIKKPDFIVCHAHFLNTTAQYSDVVLPVTTQWERDGLLQDDGNRETIFFGSKAIEPQFESRDDMWIAREIGARLGLDTGLIESATQAQQVYNSASGAMVIKDDGNGYEPLLTITEEDIKDIGAVGTPQKGRIPFKEFREKGVFQVPRSPNDSFRHIPLEEFRKDPVKNPVTTRSGKLEIHCQDLAEFVASFGWSVIKPVPVYLQPIEGYEASYSNFKTKTKGEYPLQFYSVHYLRRAGSTYDNVSWLREAWPQDFFINPIDAGERGIKHGDTIKASSRHGAVIRRAHVTSRIRPGVTSMGAGAWSELDEKLGADKAGSTNMLTGDITTGQGTSGWNSCLLEVEKLDMELVPDHRWPARILFNEDSHE